MHSYGQLNFSSDPKRTAAVGETYGSTITVNDPEAVLSCPVKPDWLKLEFNNTSTVHDYGPPVSVQRMIAGDKNGNIYFPWIDSKTGIYYFAKISRDQSVNYNWKKLMASEFPRSLCEMNGYIYALYPKIEGGVLVNTFLVRFSIDRPEQPEEI